ncbi:MAG TPA: hypothetical protein P5228_05685 [Bacteroidales bacterium]|nr:hypothetical protein [Bacteroidales bacterium]HRZ49240.1 hypothetical protein [Bacteroidales bacterium]
MHLPWQEIITSLILAGAIFWLLRKYVFKRKPVKGAGASECAPCSTGSCDGCAVMELKKEIELRKK